MVVQPSTIKLFLILGVGTEDNIADWSNIVHPKDLASTLEIINKAISEVNPFSMELRLLGQMANGDGFLHRIIHYLIPTMNF